MSRAADAERHSTSPQAGSARWPRRFSPGAREPGGRGRRLGRGEPKPPPLVCPSPPHFHCLFFRENHAFLSPRRGPPTRADARDGPGLPPGRVDAGPKSPPRRAAPRPAAPRPAPALPPRSATAPGIPESLAVPGSGPPGQTEEIVGAAAQSLRSGRGTVTGCSREGFFPQGPVPPPRLSAAETKHRKFRPRAPALREHPGAEFFYFFF